MGIFSTKELAEARVVELQAREMKLAEASRTQSRVPVPVEIDEQSLDTPIELWIGN